MTPSGAPDIFAATALAASDPAADVAGDLRALAGLATARGASRAAPVAARDVVVDERLPGLAHRSDCDGTCASLMSPPFCPGPVELGAWLAAYERGVLVQVASETSLELPPLAQGAEGWCCTLSAVRRTEAYQRTLALAWQRLHDIVSRVERDAMRRGYYLSVGLVAGDCELCPSCDPAGLCRNPLAARPSLEAVGIDVARTLRNVGWDETPPRGGLAAWTGLVLVV